MRCTTKTFTAVLIMRLVAQGKLGLDAAISRYLPGLLPDGNRITVRELLSHTSGLYGYENSASMLHVVANELTKVWTPAELIQVGEEHPRLFAPGTQFSYSTTGYIVLGLLAERVGGEPYAEQLRDYIIRPLHLSHTTLPTGTGTLPDIHGYFALSTWDQTASSAPADITALSPTAAWSGGGIRSTVQDVASFYRTLFSSRLLPKAEVAAMEDTKATPAPMGSASCRPAETPTSGAPARRRSTPTAAVPGATAATSPATTSCRSPAPMARVRPSCS